MLKYASSLGSGIGRLDERIKLTMYLYIKALHIIFIVTWFSGMFYIVRLFIYNTEASEKTGPEREILLGQFGIMIRRLWLGITWPSAILTVIFGPWIWIMLGTTPRWLTVKLVFVVLLYMYHFSLHVIYREQQKRIFRFSSQKLRIWNEMATVLLFVIVFLASVKQAMSWVFGLAGIISLALVLMLAIRIYKKMRTKKN
jgi:protoporphyrinogen IX oxidase